MYGQLQQNILNLLGIHIFDNNFIKTVWITLDNIVSATNN